MPIYEINEPVDILWHDTAGAQGRQPALVLKNAVKGARGIAAMPLVRITRPSVGPYSGTIRAHADLIAPRRSIKNPGRDSK